jgi:hypothetical protein
MSNSTTSKAAEDLALRVADALRTTQDAKYDSLMVMITQLTVTCEAIKARLDALDQATGTISNVETKRAVRTSQAGAAHSVVAAPGGARKAASKGQGGDAKVTNALLYFRHAMARDLGDIRASYGSEENLREAEEKDKAAGKKNKALDPEGYYSAVAAYLWRQRVITDADKESIRAHYNAWKEQSTRSAAQPQLEVEPDE